MYTYDIFFHEYNLHRRRFVWTFFFFVNLSISIQLLENFQILFGINFPTSY